MIPINITTHSEAIRTLYYLKAHKKWVLTVYFLHCCLTLHMLKPVSMRNKADGHMMHWFPVEYVAEVFIIFDFPSKDVCLLHFYTTNIFSVARSTLIFYLNYFIWIVSSCLGKYSNGLNAFNLLKFLSHCIPSVSIT